MDGPKRQRPAGTGRSLKATNECARTPEHVTAERFNALRAAVSDARLRLEDVKIYAAMLDQRLVASAAGEVTCRASRERLADESGAHSASVRRCTIRLEEFGYLLKRGSTGRHPATYVLSMLNPSTAAQVKAPNPCNPARVQKSKAARVQTSKKSPNPCNPARVEAFNPGTCAPLYLEQPHFARALADIDSIAHAVADELEEPKALQQDTNHSPAAANAFAKFWDAYPRREGKAAAEKAWGRLRLNGHADKIIADVLARTADPGQWTDRKFIPLPSTYLNGKRWLDEWSPTRAAGAIDRDERSDDEIEMANQAELARFGLGGVL